MIDFEFLKICFVVRFCFFGRRWPYLGRHHARCTTKYQIW